MTHQDVDARAVRAGSHFGREQLLHQPERGRGGDGMRLLHEPAGSVRLAGAGQSEAEHIGGTLEEVAAGQLAWPRQHAFGQPLRMTMERHGTAAEYDEASPCVVKLYLEVAKVVEELDHRRVRERKQTGI